jgi:hypothetical protein
MVSQLHGNHLSKVFALGKSFLTLNGFGVIVSKRRLEWTQRLTRRIQKKGGGKGPSKGKRKSEESTSHLGKKDFSKIKLFNCHKHSHYASQCPDKKKGKGKQQQKQVAASAETQMNEFVAKFEKDF